MKLITHFDVLGRPAPQGSKTYLGRGRFKEQSPHVAAWRNDVRNAAAQAFGEALVSGPLLVTMSFYFRRPKNHHVSNNYDRPLKTDAPFWVEKSPDLDKLQRATNDALTGVIWVDDKQVVATVSQKYYTDAVEGATIRVFLLEDKSPLSAFVPIQ